MSIVKPAFLTMAEGQLVVDAACRHAPVYQTGAQRLSERSHVFAIEMARSSRLGPIHTAYAECPWRDGLRRDQLPEEPAPPKEELDWDLFLGPSVSGVLILGQIGRCGTPAWNAPVFFPDP